MVLGFLILLYFSNKNRNKNNNTDIDNGDVEEYPLLVLSTPFSIVFWGTFFDESENEYTFDYTNDDYKEFGGFSNEKKN